MKKSKELKKLDKFIAQIKRETKSLYISRPIIKKYEMTCNAVCLNGYSVKSKHKLKGHNKRQLRKRLIADIKATYPADLKCRIKRSSITVKEIRI